MGILIQSIWPEISLDMHHNGTINCPCQTSIRILKFKSQFVYKFVKDKFQHAVLGIGAHVVPWQCQVEKAPV
jgi:hypothetical protein